ncbi:MAG: hypothetical protein GX444_12450 [Myxococcales bacterium]|nr:hypothetical protein [Myxococcales bacterium]
MNTVTIHEIFFYFAFAWPLAVLFSWLLLRAGRRPGFWPIFGAILTGPAGTVWILGRSFLDIWNNPPVEFSTTARRIEQDSTQRVLAWLLYGGLVATALTGLIVFLHPGWTRFYFALIKIHSWLGYLIWPVFFIYLYRHVRHYASVSLAVHFLLLGGLLSALMLTLNYATFVEWYLNIPIFIACLFIGRRIGDGLGAEGDSPMYRAGIALTVIVTLTFASGAYLAEPFNSWLNNNMGLYVLYIHGEIPMLLLPLLVGLTARHVWPQWRIERPAAVRRAMLAIVLLTLFGLAGFSVYENWKWFGYDAGQHFWPPYSINRLTEKARRNSTTYVTYNGPPPASAKGAFPRGTERPFDDFTVCGQPACHPDIVEDWRGSPHHFAASNDFFVKVIERMAAELGSDELNYFCLNCHAPSLVLHPDREKGITIEQLKKSEGVTCKSCHLMTYGVRTERPWDGLYEVRPESYYPVTLDDPDYLKKWGSYIRWDLRLHFRNYSIPHLSVSSEICSGCHVSAMPSFLTGLPHDMKVTDLHTSMKKSEYAKKGETCVTCHMPYRRIDVRNFDYPDHRIPGLNVGLSLTVSGDKETMKAVHKMEDFTRQLTTGRYPWPDAMPFLELTLETPAQISPGEALRFLVKTKNSRVGHYFHAGPSSLNEVWLEAIITDQTGRIVFHSGSLDEENRQLDPNAHRLGAKVLDRDGNVIRDCSIWRVGGVQGARRIDPLKTVEDVYQAPIPVDARGPLTIVVRWNHRRASQAFVDWVYGGKGPAFPIVELITASKTVAVAP